MRDNKATAHERSDVQELLTAELDAVSGAEQTLASNYVIATLGFVGAVSGSIGAMFAPEKLKPLRRA